MDSSLSVVWIVACLAEHVAVAEQSTDMAYTRVCTRMALYGRDTFRARFPLALWGAVLVNEPSVEILGPGDSRG